jgi:hypothetical protein
MAGAEQVNPQAMRDLTGALLDPLIAVDYPSASNRLAKLKASFLEWAAGSDGGFAGVFDLGFGPKEGRDQVIPEIFFVDSGSFTKEEFRNYYKNAQDFSHQLSRIMLAELKALNAAAAFDSKAVYAENVVAVDGISFDTSSVTTTVDGRAAGRNTQYLGVVGGNVVVADSEATLGKYLPAVLANTALADGIHIAANPGEFGWMAINGEKLVDLIVEAGKLDLADDDVRSEVNSLKTSYASGGPISAVFTAGQARGTCTVTIPYKFVATSIHLGQYLSAQRINLGKLFGKPAAPPANPDPLDGSADPVSPPPDP